MSNSDNGGGCFILILLAIVLGLCCILPICCGIGGFGPTNNVTGTVITKHVDAARESSAYMVTTNVGTFEVNNGILLGVWNSDEIYGQIEVGKTYNFTTEGNKVIFLWFLQYYPYITDVQLVK